MYLFIRLLFKGLKPLKRLLVRLRVPTKLPFVMYLSYLEGADHLKICGHLMKRLLSEQLLPAIFLWLRELDMRLT